MNDSDIDKQIDEMVIDIKKAIFGKSEAMALAAMALVKVELIRSAEEKSFIPGHSAPLSANS